MKITYDSQADALYIELRPLEAGTASCRDLTEGVTADYGPDGKLAGLEILDASALLQEDADHLVLEVAPAMLAKIA